MLFTSPCCVPPYCVLRGQMLAVVVVVWCSSRTAKCVLHAPVGDSQFACLLLHVLQAMPGYRK
jgi:hypothetical protein